MESIAELRQKLQTNVAGHPILQRVLSIYITRLILPTSMSANHVTILMLLVGFVAPIPLFFGYLWLGLGLKYLCILLDAVDGEVARYRKVYSLRGIYLDLVNHVAMQGWFFLGLGFGIAQTQEGPLYIAVLMATVIGAMAFPLRRANGDLHRELFVHYWSPNPSRFPLPQAHAHTDHDDGHHHGHNHGHAHGNAQTKRSPLSLVKRVLYASEQEAIMLVQVVCVLFAEIVFFPNSDNHPLLVWLLIAHATVGFLYLVKEIISGYHDIEHRVASVRDRFASHPHA